MKFRNREISVFSISALDLFASALGAFILIAIVLMPYFLGVDRQEVAQLRQAVTQAQAVETAIRERLQQAEAREAEARRRMGEARTAEAAIRERLQRAKASEAEARGRMEEARATDEGNRARLKRTRGTLGRCEETRATCGRRIANLERDSAGLQKCQAELNTCSKTLSRTFLAILAQWSTEEHDVDLHVVDTAGREFYFDKKKIRGRPGELSVDTVRGPGVEVWEVAEAPAGKYKVRYNLYRRNGNQAPAIVKGGVYHRDGHDRFHERQLTDVGRRNAVLVAVVEVRKDGSVLVFQE